MVTTLHPRMKPVKVVTVTFVYVGGRESLKFAGTRKWRRTPAPEELLTQPKLLSDWAVQAGLLDRGIEVAAVGVVARLDQRGGLRGRDRVVPGTSTDTFVPARRLYVAGPGRP